MIFGQHNFTTNFLNAIGYQDEFMADQIIIDEVARLIVEEKKSVVEALRKSGVNATYRDNNDLIKSMLVKEIEDKNPEILRFLSDKIVQNQIDENKVKEIATLAAKANATGKKANASGSPEPAKSTFASTLNTVLSDKNVQDSLSTLISGGIQKVFSKNNTSKTTNDQLLSERLKINEMQAAAAAKTSKKKILIFVLASAGVLIVGGVVYFLMARKYAKGGMIDNNVQNPELSTSSMPPDGAV